MKIAIKDLKSKLQAPIALFVCMASFETRCRSIFEDLLSVAGAFVVFKNVQAGKLADDNYARMLAAAGESGTGISLDIDEPMATTRALLTLMDHIKVAGEGDIFVDVTTFTHEQLLILFRIFSVAPMGRRVVFGYTGADRYSTNTEVLGFPGNLRPSRRLHLLMLVGFEHERAKAVIEAFEPSILTLGLGDLHQSVSSAHYESNKIFYEDVRKFVERRASLGGAVRQFSFSCVDPELAKSAILAQADELPEYNTVICPMNTKLSTLGAALAATERSDIQICYSRAIEYNEVGYSTPSDHVTLFSMAFDA
jgi:hypothetical protein